jgi:hypothetical protein
MIDCPSLETRVSELGQHPDTHAEAHDCVTMNAGQTLGCSDRTAFSQGGEMNGARI